jgi:hypothetical protein
MPFKNDDLTFDEAKARLLEALFDHIGKEKAVGMDVLFTKVFNESVAHKINDTKKIRKLVTAVRGQGRAIASTCANNGGGYYIPRAGSELEEYLARMLHRPALRKLAMEAKIRKVSLPELIGQMSINFEAQGSGLEAQGEE